MTPGRGTAAGGGFGALRHAAERAVAEGVVPGLVLLVGQADRTCFFAAFGSRRLVPTAEPASTGTVYDLASLSKAAITSVLAMRAVEAGALRLEDQLAAHLEGLDGLAAGDKAAITLGQVLSHAGGFVAHRPFYASALEGGRAAGSPEARRRVVEAAAREPLAHPPGSRSVYSDLGFILLGEALERRLGAPLDRLADREILQTALGPVGASPGLGFGSWAQSQPDVAPTERCPVRGRVVWGEVHDLNAYAMGGVAGHAGLFGGAEGVAALVRALVAAWRGGAVRSGARPIVEGEVLRRFWSPAGVPGSTWRLGWDGPTASGSLAGDRIARSAVGHLAFTGCSLWIDPEREAFVIVLANRIHPTVRDDARFPALRRALNDAAWEGLGL